MPSRPWGHCGQVVEFCSKKLIGSVQIPAMEGILGQFKSVLLLLGIEKPCSQAGQKGSRCETSTQAPFGSEPQGRRQPSGAREVDPSTSLRTGLADAYLGGTLERGD